MSSPDQNLPHSAETVEAGQGSARRRNLFARLATLAVEGLAFVLTVSVIVTGIVAWRLSSAPLSLAFLTPYVEAALSPGDESFAVKVESTQLIWAGWERNLDVRLGGVRVIARDGTTLVQVSDLAVKFSLRALARGTLAPTEIEISRPTVRVVRTETGGIEMGLGQGGPPSFDILQGILGNIMGQHGSGPLAYLTSFGMTGAALDIEDRSLGFSWHIDDADIGMLRTPQGMDARLRFGIDIGTDRPHFDLRLTYAERDQDLAADLVFSGLRPRTYAAQIPALAGLEPVDVPLSGRLTGKLDIAAAAGQTFGFDQVSFRLTGDEGTLRLGGTILHSDVPVRRFAADGTLGVRQRSVRVDALEFGLVGGANLSLAGWAEQSDGRLGFSLQSRVAGISAADLPRFWPQGVKDDTREWIEANIREGRINDGLVEASGSARLDGSEDIHLESLRGEFSYTGLQVTYFAKLPPVRGIRGRGTFDQTAMNFTVEQGDLNGLRVEEGVVHIGDLGKPIEPLSVDAVVKGQVARVLEVLDTPPLRFASAVGISPGAVAGVAASRVAFRFPLIAALKLSDLRFSAAANIVDVGVRRALGNFDLKAPNLSLALDGNGLEIKGDATIGPLRGAVRWTEAFSENAAVRSHYEYRGPVTAEAQRDIGIGLAPFLRGPVGADLAYDVRRNGTAELSGRLDLAPSELGFAVLGWAKPAGTPGLARFTVALDKGVLRSLSSLQVEAAGLSMSAAGPFLADGKGLDELRIDRLKVGRNDLRMAIKPRPAGVTEITLQGGSLDLAPYLETETAEGGAKDPPIAISGSLDSVWLADAQTIEKLSGHARRDDEDWQEAEIVGQLSENGGFTLSLKPEGTGRAFAMQSTNAGALLRAAGIFENMIGGQMQTSGQFSSRRADAAFAGRVEINDYRVVEAPVMARLLASASLRGPLDLLTGEGIGFSRLTAPFKYEAKRLTVERSRAYGAALGINALGHVDFKSRTVSLSGTIVPIYTVNRILGSIPIIGSILTGGEGEGVFAVTYKLDGPIDNPAVSVNPLSALAPGFLRNLFGMIEGPEPTVPQVESQP